MSAVTNGAIELASTEVIVNTNFAPVIVLIVKHADVKSIRNIAMDGTNQPKIYFSGFNKFSRKKNQRHRQTPPTGLVIRSG